MYLNTHSQLVMSFGKVMPSLGDVASLEKYVTDLGKHWHEVCVCVRTYLQTHPTSCMQINVSTWAQTSARCYWEVMEPLKDGVLGRAIRSLVAYSWRKFSEATLSLLLPLLPPLPPLRPWGEHLTHMLPALLCCLTAGAKATGEKRPADHGLEFPKPSSTENLPSKLMILGILLSGKLTYILPRIPGIHSRHQNVSSMVRVYSPCIRDTAILNSLNSTDGAHMLKTGQERPVSKLKSLRTFMTWQVSATEEQETWGCADSL